MPAVHLRILPYAQLPHSLRVAQKRGGDAIDRIINEGKDVPRHKVDAGDDRHHPIYELAKVVALNVFLNRPVEPRKVTDEARQALMPGNILIPLVKVTQHPGVPICPAVVIPTKIGIHDHVVAHAGSELGEGEEKHLLGVDPVVLGVAGEDGDRRSHPRRQRSQAEVSVEMTQLTLIEVHHLQCLDVVEVGKP